MFFRVLRRISVIHCYLQSPGAPTAESAAARQLYYCTYESFYFVEKIAFAPTMQELLRVVLRNNKCVNHNSVSLRHDLMEMMRNAAF
jgi:hypothetical protein